MENYHCIQCGAPIDEPGLCDTCQLYGDDDGKDEDFYLEQREREMEDRAANCSCGAWQMTNDGEVIHVADCCCGAE